MLYTDRPQLVLSPLHYAGYHMCVCVFTTATDGTDFTLPPQFQVVFGTNSSVGDTQSVTIAIEDDEIIEGEEMFCCHSNRHNTPG